MGPGGPGQIPSGPRTSSPNVTDGGTMIPNSMSFPSPPLMRAGPRPGGVLPPRGPYGPGPLPPNHMVGPVVPRDYPPGPFPPPPGSGHFPPGPPLPSHTLRDFTPPHLLRDFPLLGMRGFPPGPRSMHPGPTPPPGVHRDFPPGPDVRRWLTPPSKPQSDLQHMLKNLCHEIKSDCQCQSKNVITYRKCHCLCDPCVTEAQAYSHWCRIFKKQNENLQNIGFCNFWFR